MSCNHYAFSFRLSGAGEILRICDDNLYTYTRQNEQVQMSRQNKYRYDPMYTIPNIDLYCITER